MKKPKHDQDEQEFVYQMIGLSKDRADEINDLIAASIIDQANRHGGIDVPEFLKWALKTFKDRKEILIVGIIIQETLDDIESGESKRRLRL